MADIRLLTSVHAHVRSIAEELGISTDDVMFLVGMHHDDLSVVCDPRIGAKFRHIIETVPDRERQQDLTKAVESMVAGIFALGENP